MKNVILIAVYVVIAITINSLLIVHSLNKYQRVPHSIGEIRIGHTYTWQEDGENKGCQMTVEELSRIVRPEPFNGQFIEVERACGYLTCNGSPVDGIGDDEVCFAARVLMNPKYVIDRGEVCVRDASGKSRECQPGYLRDE
jgi:hypothetical protein